MKLKARNNPKRHELRIAALEGLKIITREDIEHLVMFISSRLKTVNNSKVFAANCINVTIMVICLDRKSVV